MELQGLEAQIDVSWRGYYRRIVIHFLLVYLHTTHPASVSKSSCHPCLMCRCASKWCCCRRYRDITATSLDISMVHEVIVTVDSVPILKSPATCFVKWSCLVLCKAYDVHSSFMSAIN